MTSVECHTRCIRVLHIKDICMCRWLPYFDRHFNSQIPAMRISPCSKLHRNSVQLTGYHVLNVNAISLITSTTEQRNGGVRACRTDIGTSHPHRITHALISRFKVGITIRYRSTCSCWHSVYVLPRNRNENLSQTRTLCA